MSNMYLSHTKRNIKSVDINIGNAIQNIETATISNVDIVPLNLIQQGTASWNRISNRVELVSLRISGSIYHTTTIGRQTSGNLVRMVVLWDKQPTSLGIPTFDSIFGRTYQDGSKSCGLLDGIRYGMEDRFKILLDKRYDINPGFEPTNGGVKTNIFGINEHLIFNHKYTTFSGQSNPMTIGDISTGALYIIFRAIQSQSNNSTYLDWNNSVCRLKYYD